MFPFNKPKTSPALSEKMKDLQTQLAAAAQGAAQPEATQVGGEAPRQTIADDGPLPADKQAAIARDEDLIRRALQVVGIDYDALIATEGNTPYAQATKANPKVLEDVLNDPQPVLRALQVAVGFKPYAAFAEKYGTEPEAIRAAIAAEVLGEAEENERTQKRGKEAQALPFSRPAGSASAKGGKPKGKDAALESFFKR